MSAWIVDTGPLVAYLVSDDPAHSEVAACLDRFSGQLITTSAVITEAMHFVGQARNGPRLLADLVVATEMAVFDFCEPGLLGVAAELMEKFADTPMDFADATLLLLAEEAGNLEILTLDRRGFSTYRTRQGEPLRLVLDRV